MGIDMPEELVEWVRQIGIREEIRYSDIESGKLVGVVLKGIGEGFTLEILQSNSASNRMTNWTNIITQLKELEIKVGKEDKMKIINGNRQLIYSVLNEIRQYYIARQNETAINIEDITENSQISKASSLLQLFILSSIQHFALTAKQAVALLANETKYLSHILAKGIKGNFTPVEAFILELKNNVNLIVSFCKNKQNQIFFIQALKPALISKSENVAEFALILFDNYLHVVQHKYEIVKDYLLTTLIMGMRRHPKLTKNIANFIYRHSENNKNLLMNLKAQTNDTQYQEMLMQIWEQSKREDRLNDLLEMKGIRQIVPMLIQNLKDSDTLLSSLNLLIQICNAHYSLFVGKDNSENFMENINKATLVDEDQILLYIKYLFQLLSIFANSKNDIAPKLLKVIIGKYKHTINEKQSQLFLVNFEQIVREFPSIPFHSITEAIQNRIDSNTLHAGEIELQFLKSLLDISKMDSKSAIIVFNITSKIFIQEINRLDGMERDICHEIIIKIARKYLRDKNIEEALSKLIKVSLAVHFASIRKMYNDSGKKQQNERMMKQNQRIENLLRLLSKQDMKEIHQTMEPLLSYSIIQITQIDKEYAKGLLSIVSNFGNSDTIVKKYENEIKKMTEQALKKQAKKERMKNNRYSQSPLAKSGKKLQKAESSSNLFGIRKKSNNMFRSQSGITESAQKGLVKYHQAFLNKLGKAEEEKLKQKEIEEREQVLKQIFQRKMLEKGIGVKKITQNNFKYLHDFETKEKQLEEDMVKGKINLPYYQSTNEEERDIRALNYLMKKYQRVLKVYYSSYSGYHRPNAIKLFDSIADQSHLLYSAALWKLIKDNSLDQFLNVKEMQYICKRINLKLKKQFVEPTALDYQGFEQFILQVSFSMFTRPPKDLRGHPIAEMVQETFSNLKLYASENRIDEQLFEDPDTVFFNETEAIRQLNKKLTVNPKYILPEGYKKVVENKINYTHKLNPNYLPINYRNVYEILSEILQESLEINIIEPLTVVETVSKARPSLYYNQRQQVELNSQKLSIFLKKEVSKFPMRDRQIAKQSAIILDDVIIAVELGHERIGEKIVNKFKKQRMKRQEEIKKRDEEQKQKWMERNQELKSALIKHKKVAQKRKKEEIAKKQEQEQKQQVERRRKEEEQRQLKKKVKQYHEKKRIEEQRRRQQSEERKRKEKEEFEKKRKEWEETKMWIQQVKQQRQQEERKRKVEEQEEAKRRKKENRIKLEEDFKKKQQMLQQYKNKRSQVKKKQ